MRTDKSKDEEEDKGAEGKEEKHEEKHKDRMDQMLWERHLATTEAAQAQAKCLDMQSAGPLIASYERLVEGWANQGTCWCDLASSWREVVTIMIAQNADKIGTGTG